VGICGWRQHEASREGPNQTCALQVARQQRNTFPCRSACKILALESHAMLRSNAATQRFDPLDVPSRVRLRMIEVPVKLVNNSTTMPIAPVAALKVGEWDRMI
jgi:hypothetical protein